MLSIIPMTKIETGSPSRGPTEEIAFGLQTTQIGLEPGRDIFVGECQRQSKNRGTDFKSLVEGT